MQPSTIDLLLTNGLIQYQEPYIINDFASDHLPVRFEINYYVTPPEPTYRHLYSQANWALFRRALEHKLKGRNLNSPNDSSQAIDNKIEILTSEILSAKDTSIPKVKQRPERNFITSEIKHQINSRNYFRRKFLRNRSPEDKKWFNFYKQLVKNNIANAKSLFYDNIMAECCETKSNSIYKLARNSRQTKLPSQNTNGTLLLSAYDKVNALGTFFESNHRNPLAHKDRLFTMGINQRVFNITNQPPLDDTYKCTFAELLNEIKSLKMNKGTGPDGINNRLIKNLPPSVINCLVNLFNASLALLGHFPEPWKVSFITPLAKQGKDPKLVTSYRPISMLSGIGKLYEKIIKRRLTSTETYRDILPNEQYGFRPGHSTSHQLLRLYSSSRTALNDKLSIGLISLDIEKAFDRVWHEGLIYKLMKANFPSYLIQTIKSYLTNRSSCVKVENIKSTPFKVPSGVPQGGILSPILYLIFTADLPAPQSCSYGIFADDTSLTTQSRRYLTIESQLQESFLNLKSFFQKWKIAINTAKTQAIFITNRKTKQLPTGPLRLDNVHIDWLPRLKYLGFTYSNNLSFKPHIDASLFKATRAAGAINHLICRKSKLNIQTKTKLYLLYIRPVLTYAEPLLYHAPPSLLLRLQRFQNKILRLICRETRYTKTVTLHKLTNVPLISAHLQTVYSKFIRKARDSENPLIQELSADQN